MQKTKYNEVIYPSDVKNPYPEKLTQYLIDRFKLYTGASLDIGCGVGTYTKLFYELRYANITAGEKIYSYGIDKSPDYENVVKGAGSKSRNYIDLDRIKKCDVEYDQFPFDDDTMSFVFSKSLIEHLPSAEHMMQNIVRVLRPGGRIILMTPSWTSQWSHFWDDHTHVHPYTHKGLMNMLKIYGFKNVTCETFYQLPYLWRHPFFKFIQEAVSLLPASWKWKDNNMRNGSDRKWIRFSKEAMLLATGTLE